MPSITKNIFWNSLRTGVNMVFPLITFPYTARVFGPAVKGEYDYAYAIVSYFILFANLGFPIYGIREISKNRNSRKELSKAVSGIFTANVISVSVVILLYAVFCALVNDEELLLFMVVGLSILFSCIQFDWFYQGVEDFRYITIRSIVVKILSVVALFILVKDKEDLIVFAAISVVGEFGNNIFNLLRIGKYADLRLSLENCWKHTRGASTLFLGTIAVSLYTKLNTVMLGALDTKESVGLFTAGNKMVYLVLSVISAMLATIIPRISYQMGVGSKEEGPKLQYKVLKSTLYVCYPLMILLFFLSKDVIMLLAGDYYLRSIPVLKILSLLIVIIPLSGFLGLQVLYPVRKEKYGNYATIIGAITNISLNYFLILHFSFIGISISVVLSEFMVTAVHYYYGRRYLPLPLTGFFPRNALFSTIVMAGVLAMATVFCTESGLFPFLLKAIVSICIYIIVLKLLNDSLLDEILVKITKK